MRVNGSLVVALVLLAGLTGCAAQPVVELTESTIPNREQAPAPVFTSGDSWSFRAVEKFLDGYTSDLLNGDYEIALQGGSPDVKLDGAARLNVRQLNELGKMVPGAATLQDAQQFFNFPLWVGKKWRATYFPFPEGGRGQHWKYANNEVTGIEMVPTPAGTFRAFRIERRVQYPVGFGDFADHNENYLTFTYFYSPQTQSIVKYHFQREEKIDTATFLTLVRTSDIELIKFDPGTGKPATVAEGARFNPASQ